MTEISFEISRHKMTKWPLVRLAFGILLLIAAFLKMRNFGTPTALFDIAPPLEFGLIQFEVVLALWLISGWRTAIAWLCTLGLFSCFAGASLAMMAQEKAECGCFGSFDVSPLSAFLIDVLAVSALLLVARVELYRVGNQASNWIEGKLNQRFLKCATCVSAIAMSFGFAGLYFSTEIGAWYARNMPITISGHVLVTEPLVIRATPSDDEGWHKLRFSVVNRGGESIRLIGAEQNCKCRSINSLPIDIPVGGKASIDVDVKKGAKTSFALLTSSRRQKKLV